MYWLRPWFNFDNFEKGRGRRRSVIGIKYEKKKAKSDQKIVF